MVYAKFGGQTECIMGNWKIENCILAGSPNEAAYSYQDERGRGKAKKLANIAIYRLFDEDRFLPEV